MFIYESPFGFFTIHPAGDKFALYLRDDCLGWYGSAAGAATDVYTQHTGDYEWDSLELPPDVPTCIYEWLYCE